MNYLIITNAYPKSGDYYRNAFVHRRLKKYKEFLPSIKLTVYVLNKDIKVMNNYVYDSIEVFEGNKKNLELTLQKLQPDKLLVHFLNRHMMDVMRKSDFKIPAIIWIHGVEALGWYRRLFNFDFKEFPKYIMQNTRQLINLKKFLKNTKYKNINFIFVSEWMKQILEKDTNEKVQKYEIVPNVIDSNIFPYEEKNLELRKKILLIRPFASKKYANDIAINAIKQLSKWVNFEELEFLIIGEGKLFSELTRDLKKYDNVILQERFLPQDEIAQFHKEYGIFLCPTRQDAQGVSMCEAMSSGLVPITSENTAIPEFVKNGHSGFLTNTPIEIAESIIKLYENPDVFSEISENASATIQKMCGLENTIEKELKMIINNE